MPFAKSSSLVAVLGLAVAATQGVVVDDFRGDSYVPSSWFSEENGGRSDLLKFPISSMRTSGRFADSMQLLGTKLGSGEVLDTSSITLTSEFSEESSRACPAGRLVTGIRCSGRYCDNKRLECAALRKDYQVDTARVAYSATFSEETGVGQCAFGTYMSGLQCSGRYCDNLRMTCTLLQMTRSFTLSFGNSGCLTSSAGFAQCAFDDNKRWVLEDDGAVRAFTTDKCLQQSGSNVIVATCNGASTQKFGLTDGRLHLASDNNQCVVASGSSVGLASCTNAARITTKLALPEALDEHALALKFAPQLRFDQSAKQFPVSGPSFWERSYTNEDGHRVFLNQHYRQSNAYNPSNMGMHYEVQNCNSNGRVLIVYWIYYEYQGPCIFNIGGHWGDWERVVVELDSTRSTIRSIRYYQHSGWYTKFPNQVNIVDRTHPVAYVGKVAHGSYHDDGGSGTCLYYEDFRNEGSPLLRYNAWSQGTLLSIKGNEPWQTFTGKWGWDGINGPGGRPSNLCTDALCKNDGCSKSSDNSGSSKVLDGEQAVDTPAVDATPIVAGSIGGVAFLAAIVAVVTKVRRTKAQAQSSDAVGDVEVSNPTYEAA